ncbi:HAMP domain-containing protein [Rhodocytophaga rosea]|uniref:histidine kinase n=1 Tax=Rhodocytophaga rosea TaxID=2704465 RepID=A0A6C0GSI3_9BACT|nr:sensor histidine kinase [Rhodocytophaga rosea]QHT70482.1 HAMP domain-containing protein [Rhodocytophaga rosea]
MRIAILIFAGFIVILFLFSVTTFVNYRQSLKVKENTDWVYKSQVVIRNSLRFQRNLTEMESGLRGFLFTGENSFLEPFDSAASENETLIAELHTLIQEHSFQQERLAEIRRLHEQWEHEFAQPLIAAKQQAVLVDTDHKSFSSLYNSKDGNRTERNIRKQIRDKFREFNNYEYNLRDERGKALTASVAGTEFISFSLTSLSIFIGLAIAVYISYRISQRINSMVTLAGQIASGNLNVQMKDTAKDELSHLSTSLNRMARTLSENISELERKNIELDRFAYVVSHDLKAPLRGIENASTWIEEDYGNQLPEQVKEYLTLMRGRIRRMENLINGILELARVGRHKSPLELVNVELMLQELIEMLAPQPGIQVSIQPDMPVLLTERVPLQQVFINLLSNAIKYHHLPEGKISITYHDNDTHYAFSVTDDGPGIEPQYHEKIFIVFQTLKERDAFESTGVGLAIVKKILDDKKCTIKVDSQAGKGAAFTFTWPKN